MQFSKQELLAVALVGGMLPLSAVADEAHLSYPERPLTLVIGYPPGGGNDYLARSLAQQLGNELGQKVLIDYRPGAASNIGAETVARATPDGYTLYLAGRPNTIHKVMYPHIKYDFSQDLTPVGLLATTPYVMVVNQHAPISNIEDLTALAKAYPGGLTCASGGTGTTDHLLCELFQQEAEIDMVHVPYRGSTPAFVDVIGGRVDMYISPLPTALPHITAGTVRPLALMAESRLSVVKDVPAIAEMGYAGLALGAWYGVMAPAGTPSHIVKRLNRSLNAALERTDLREALKQRAYVVPSPPNTPDLLGDTIAQETARWTALLEQRNIKPLH